MLNQSKLRESRLSLATASTVFKCMLATVSVLAMLIALPAGASAAFNVSGFAVTPSTTVKSANPNLTASFTRSGTTSEDLKSFEIQLPTGLTISTTSVPKCTDARLAADSCPSNSSVGDVTANLRADALGGYLQGDVAGSLYAMSNSGSAQRVGIVLRPWGTSLITTQTFAPGAPGTKATVSNVPRTVYVLGILPVDITLNSLSLKYKGKGAAGEIIVTNPPTCVPATSTLIAKSYLNVAVTRTSAFTPTGCAPAPTPPVVEITSPSEPASTTTSSINVAFTVDGGATIPAGVACAVNGAATTNTGTNNVVLAVPGPNPIVVTCTNSAGAGSDSIVVTLENAVPANVRIDVFAAPSTGAAPANPSAGSPEVLGQPVSVSFSLPPGSPPATSFQCRIPALSPAWSACTTSSATSGTYVVPTSSLTSLLSGQNYTYEVRAVNGAVTGQAVSGTFYYSNASWGVQNTVTALPNSITPSGQELQAGRHPNVQTSLAYSGWDDPKSLDTKFPDGLMVSLAAIPEANRCSFDDQQAGKCPASSAIGTLDGVATNPRDGDVALAGSAYLMKVHESAHPVPAQYAAAVALELTAPGGLGKLREVGYLGFANGPISVPTANTYENARLQTLTIPNIPNASDMSTASESRASALRFHIKSVNATLNGAAGATGDPATNRPLITNPHYAGPVFNVSPWTRPNQKQFVGNGTGHNGTRAVNVIAPYAVAATTQAFSPAVEFKAKASGLPDIESNWTTSVSANQQVATRTILSLPDEATGVPNATIARANVQLPPSLNVDFTSIGSDGTQTCSASTAKPTPNYAGFVSFIPQGCPPESVVGTAAIITPLFPEPVVGRIHVIGGGIANLGIWFAPEVASTNPQGVSFGIFVKSNGIALYNDGGLTELATMQLNLNSLPDIPISRFEMKIGTNESRGSGLAPTIFVGTNPMDPSCVPSPADPENEIPEIDRPSDAGFARLRPWSNVSGGTAGATPLSQDLFNGAPSSGLAPGDAESALPWSVTGCAAHF